MCAMATLRGWSSAEPVVPLAVFPDDQQLGRIENGRVGATEQSDQQDDDEVLDGGTAKKEQGQQGEDTSQLRVDGAGQRLHDAVVDDIFELLTSLAVDEVFTDAVKHHDGVVHREANHRQQGGQEVRIDFKTYDNAQNGCKTQHDEDVVEHGQQGADAVAERIGRFAEGNGQVDEDGHTRAEHCDCGTPRGFATNSGTNALQ